MEIRKNLVHEQSKGFDCKTPSKTMQEFKEECDVNNILRNYVSTGVLTHVSDQRPQFGDFSRVPADYGEALQLIEESRAAFMQLPSEVREKFDSRPENLISYLQDEKNKDEAIKLGLIKQPVTAKSVEE